MKLLATIAVDMLLTLLVAFLVLTCLIWAPPVMLVKWRLAERCVRCDSWFWVHTVGDWDGEDDYACRRCGTTWSRKWKTGQLTRVCYPVAK